MYTAIISVSLGKEKGFKRSYIEEKIGYGIGKPGFTRG